jgi:hypothetical protein
MSITSIWCPGSRLASGSSAISAGRLDRQRAREQDAGALAARQLGRDPVAQVQDVGALHRAFDRGGVRLGDPRHRREMRQSPEPDKPLDGQRPVQCLPLRHIGDPPREIAARHGAASTPSTRTVPVAGTSASIARASVDLPAPLGPTMPVSVPPNSA